MSGINCSVAGATYAAAVAANAAVAFDGTGDYYQAAGPLTTTATDSKYLTIAFTWFHPTGGNSRNQHFMTAHLGTVSGENGWEVCIQSGRFRYSSWDNSGSNTDIIYGDFPATENAWNQMVAYVDHTLFSNCKYYLNGVDRTANLLNGAAFGEISLANLNINWGATNASIKIGVKDASAQYSTAFSDFLGSIAQIYAHNAVGAPTISNYWNTTSSRPKDLGTTGVTTGLVRPLIYHYGTTATFGVNNGTGFNAYTLTGNGNVVSAIGPTYG